MTDAAKYLAEAQRIAWDVDDLPADLPFPAIASVGIIGAGTMGGGIAMNFANVNIPVKLVEQRQDVLDRGLAVIRRNYTNSARKGRFPEAEVDVRMDRLQGSLQLETLADCDLVIEAVFEDLALKRAIFRKLDGICKPSAIMATNTSGLDVDAIAAETKRPESVIGLHFFSPANVMKLLEVVRGAKTAKAVLAASLATARKIGKLAVVVGVCPGFVGNRILHPRQHQAFTLLAEGAMPWDVDGVLNRFGFKMGPFAMSDLAGLDIGWSRETSTGDNLRDLLCEQDRLGQKSGRGFYDYGNDRTPTPSPVVEELIRTFAAKQNWTMRQVSDEEILERCLYPMINEGARILSEKIASRPSDIDVVWHNGYGWPAVSAGPMFYGDGLGLAHVVERLKAYERELGADFTPAPLLKQLASEGRRFQDITRR